MEQQNVLPSEDNTPVSAEKTTISEPLAEQLNDKKETEEKMLSDDATEVADAMNNESESMRKGESPMFLLSNNGVLCLEFLEDQGREDNFTDLDLICCDGYIQVHRCLLMGASTFLRDLLIEKDIMDTTAISLPDISIRHLRLVLSLLYTGRTLIDGGDEFEVFEVMKMLGLPVADLLCRSAKNNDREQVFVLRHISEDGTCVRELNGNDEEMEQSVSMDEEKSNGPNDVAEDFQEKNEMDASRAEEKLETQKENFSPGFTEGNVEYKLKSNGTGTIVGSVDPQTNSPALRSDDEESGKGPNRNSDFESANNSGNKDNDLQSQSNNTSHSVVSDPDLEDFEEACNDLQKQVAKPMTMMNTDTTTITTTCSNNGHEMKLRKRKSTDTVESSNKVSNEQPKKMKTRSGGSAAVTKKKNVTPKKGKKGNVTNGTNHQRGKTRGKAARSEGNNVNEERSKEKSPDRESMSSVKTGKSESPSQSRLSTCSSTSDVLTRIFLEVKEFSGVKYNIYGLMDPVKGIQSGKTIAIQASKDKSRNSSVNN